MLCWVLLYAVRATLGLLGNSTHIPTPDQHTYHPHRSIPSSSSSPSSSSRGGSDRAYGGRRGSMSSERPGAGTSSMRGFTPPGRESERERATRRQLDALAAKRSGGSSGSSSREQDPLLSVPFLRVRRGEGPCGCVFMCALCHCVQALRTRLLVGNSRVPSTVLGAVANSGVSTLMPQAPALQGEEHKREHCVMYRYDFPNLCTCKGRITHALFAFAVAVMSGRRQSWLERYITSAGVAAPLGRALLMLAPPTLQATHSQRASRAPPQPLRVLHLTDQERCRAR